MARRSLEQERRRQLTTVAFEMLCNDGLAATTLSRVAAEVGVSKGMVLHYFDGKEALFESVMLRLNARLRDDMIVMCQAANSRMERLFGVIEANIAPTSFQPRVCHAWLALCAEVPLNDTYQRIQTVLHARLQSNLMSGLPRSMSRAERWSAGLQLVTMIDGLWLRNGLQTGPVARTQARELITIATLQILATAGGGSEARHAASKMQALADARWPDITGSEVVAARSTD